MLQEFPPVTTQAWEDAIRNDLKGADYARKLIWQTPEGLAVQPYYRAEDLVNPERNEEISGTPSCVVKSGDWRICEEIDAVDLEDANRAAQRAIEAGSEEIAFLNVAVRNASDLKMLLVNLHEVPVDFPSAGEPLLRLLGEKLKARPDSLRITTGWNPLDNFDFAAEIAATAPPSFVPFTIRAEDFAESGANAVQEIGFALSVGVEFLAGMQERNVEIDRAAAAISFSFSTGASYLFQIAKLRAFRRVWSQAVESFGGTDIGARTRIRTRTSRWNKTIYDPHVNVLRATTEAMSAILGGADSICVAPFDECYKTPNEASRRLARNTQIILKREVLLGQVADPGAGAYCLEVMTDYLAREAWKTMQKIESDGGYRKVSASGQLHAALDQAIAASEKAVVSRRRVLTGTNQYADPHETALDRIEPLHFSAVHRAAQPYERLRLRYERHLARTGTPLRFLLTEFGDAKMRAARSNFAANFLACAGFEIAVEHLEKAGAIAASDTDVIVLCSSDAEYPAMAAELAKELTALGRKTPLIVAGNPESADQLRAAGVADFIHIKSNPIEVLAYWQQRLGIEA